MPLYKEKVCKEVLPLIIQEQRRRLPTDPRHSARMILFQSQPLSLFFANFRNWLRRQRRVNIYQRIRAKSGKLASEKLNPTSIQISLKFWCQLSVLFLIVFSFPSPLPRGGPRKLDKIASKLNTMLTRRKEKGRAEHKWVFCLKQRTCAKSH